MELRTGMTQQPWRGSLALRKNNRRVEDGEARCHKRVEPFLLKLLNLVQLDTGIRVTRFCQCVNPTACHNSLGMFGVELDMNQCSRDWSKPVFNAKMNSQFLRPLHGIWNSLASNSVWCARDLVCRLFACEQCRFLFKLLRRQMEL